MKKSETEYKTKDLEPSNLLIFLLIAFGWTWAWWGMIIYGVINITASGNNFWQTMVFLITPFGPTIAAFVVSRFGVSKEEAKQLWQRFWNFEPAWYWWLAVIILPVLMFALPYQIERMIKGSLITPNWITTPSVIFTMFLANLVGGGLSQEFGWRGFLLPRLQARWNALLSSIITGAIWAIWLLPSWYLPPDPRTDSFFYWAGILILWSIMFTWLYNNTKGNLLIAVLLNTLGHLIVAMFTSGYKYLYIVNGFIVAVLILYFGAKSLKQRKRARRR
jgi:membrane protease YdiL (CAAX protease family)